MRARIEKLLGIPGGAMWVGTFHGIAHRLLRLHWRDANLPQSFQILDGEDQLRLIKKIVKAMELDETRWVPREIQWFINHNKDEGFRPGTLKDAGDPTRRQLIKIYTEYEAQCQRTGVVDFAELLLRAYELWRDRPEILKHYRHRFRHVLIDEFQDTNSIQYAWALLVAGPDGAPFVVGDDDQSIYRWRGARVENLTRFTKDYPAAKMYRLEQNYRSTGNILKAANALISNNTGRLGKNLWTAGAEGEHIRLYAAFNERDEAEFVMHRIRDWMNHGGARRDVAILYRSNAQSRVFEEIFMSARIPYKVYGGLRFFERAEIKDALAYLRVITNHADDASFERVVNLPVRGIGAKSLDVIREQAKAAGTHLWTAAAHCIANGALGPKAETAVNGFLKLIEQLGQDIQGLELHEQVDHVINNSGLVEHHKKEKARSRRSAGREPERTRVRRARLRAGHHGAVRRGKTAAAGIVPRARGARIGRRPGGSLGRLRADDDAAHREGPRVPGGVPRGHGRRVVPASAFAQRSGRPRRRTPPLLRRHDARDEAAVHDVRRAAPAARHGQLRHAVAIHRGDPRRAGGRGAAAHPDLAAGGRGALPRAGRRARARA